MNDFVYSILAWIQSWVGSWGWSIVVFAVLIRLVLTPLDFKSRVSMRKTQKLQPQLQALQKKYANDKEKLNAKTAELYKKEHINPLSSCLPLLLSWPVLIAVWGAMRMVANKELLIQLTQILNNEMPALEPWLWVKNLWMPDNLFSACLPDLNTLRVIPADQWQAWFSSLDQSNLPILIKDLGLTVESFGKDNLGATVQQIVTAMQQNSALAADMGSTLWFTAEDKENGIPQALLAAGQYTMCYNLLKYIGEIENTTENLTQGHQLLISLKPQLMKAWEKFQADPQWMNR